MNELSIVGRLLVLRHGKDGLISLFYQREIIENNEQIILQKYEELSSWDMKFERLVRLFNYDRIQTLVLISPAEEEYVQRLKKAFAILLKPTVDIKIECMKKIERKILNQFVELSEGNPFMNGFRLYITGLYPEQMIYDGLKHLEICEKEPIQLEQMNINSSVICRDKKGCPTYYLEQINLKKNKNKIEVTFETSKDQIDLYEAPFSRKMDFNFIDREALYVCTINNTKDTKKCISFFKKISDSGKIQIKDCLWLIQDEYKLLSSFSRERVSKNRKRIGIEHEERKAEVSHVDRYLINARNIFRSIAQKHKELGEFIKFSTKDKLQWVSLPNKPAQMISRSYVLFEIGEEYFVYSEEKKKYYRIGLDELKMLELLYYMEEDQCIKRFATETTTNQAIAKQLLNRLKTMFKLEKRDGYATTN